MMDSEKEDFKKSVHNLGYIPDEFNVTVKDVTKYGSGIVPIQEEVTITRGKTGKTYQGGHGTSWPTKAIADVEAGLFGSQ